MRFHTDEITDNNVGIRVREDGKGGVYIDAEGIAIARFANGKLTTYSNGSRVAGLTTDNHGHIEVRRGA